MTRRNATDVNVKTERNPGTRDPEKRSRPFTAVLLVAAVVVPLFCLLLRTIVLVRPGLTWLIVWLDLFLFGLALPGVALGVGYRVTKRLPFVIWHVALTVHLFAVATSLSVLPGWDRPGSGRWWERTRDAIVDTATIPGPMVVFYLFGSLALAGSWLLYRIDAFRAATGSGGDGRSDGLAELLKWPTAATIRPGSITADEHAVTATIDHKGVPVTQLQNVLPALVEQSGAIRGRSTVVPGPKGGESEISLVKSDPLKVWRPWPGLSHPGGSFAYPFRTAYYVAGEPQWFSFAKTPDTDVLPASRVAPKFKAENDAHFGRQGATRSGKSGDNSIEIAEACSRRDCIPIFVNAAKLTQDVGWALDFAGLAANTKPKARVLFDKLRELGEFRESVMGDPRLNGRHRRWTPATYDELGFAALLVEVDEGDQVLNGADATWMATKGLSLGIYVSVMISRAATDGMASTLRSAITQWKAFGAGQAYDAGFVLSDETMGAGADPGSLATKFPGSHYLDKAQGVDEVMYPKLARSFRSNEDFSDLRRGVEAARATFTPATFTGGELRVLGDAAEFLSPKAILIGVYATADRNRNNDDPTVPAVGAAPAGEMPAGYQEGTDMQRTLDMGGGREASGDPELDVLLAKPRPNFADLEREYGALPPMTEPLPDMSNPNLPAFELEGDRPVLSPEATAEEFDAALVRLHERGVTEFGNKDVMDEMRCDPSPTWVSRRFTGLCDTAKYVSPPGITIERVPGKAGRYLLVRLR